MSISILRAFLFATFPFSLMAEPAFVQSGEHANFTRLVTRIPDGKNWRLEQSEGKAILSVVGYDSGFDATRIFDFIPRDRIQRVETDRNQLILILGCDCTVIAFPVNGGHVAIDVASTGPDTESTPTTIANVRPPNLRTIPVSAPAESNVRSIDQVGFNPTARTQLRPHEVAILSEVQYNLLRELGSATTRGILEPTQSQPLRSSPLLNTSVFGNLPESKDVTLVTEQIFKTGNMRISTSMDVSPQTDDNQEVLSVMGIICPPDNTLDIASWGDERPFDQQINEARLGLFGEFDRADPEAVLKLARLYLYFGFGAEARQVLHLDPDILEEHSLLIGISDILETKKTPNNLPLQLGECDGNISLWAFLANSQNVPGMMNPTSILLALNKLPTHLRKFVAPMLSTHFLSEGDSASAAVALRSLKRLPDPLTPAAILAQAKIRIDDGANAEGTAQLEEVANDNAEESPHALVALVNAKLNSGEAINPRIAELVEAYAHELRDSDFGPDLRRAYVLSLVQSGQFDRAMSEIELIDSTEKGEFDTEVQQYFFQELAENASDIVFLDIAMQQSTSESTLVEVATALSIASRLMELGFALNAQDFLQRIPDMPVNEPRQILAARIALALNQPFRAQAELLGLDSKSANTVRAKAKQLSGAHEEAYALFQDAELQASAVQSAWLARNWRDLTTPETPIFGAVATLSNPKNPLSDSPTGMLSRTETALAESTSARQILGNLLSESQLDPL